MPRQHYSVPRNVDEISKLKYDGCVTDTVRWTFAGKRRLRTASLVGDRDETSLTEIVSPVPIPCLRLNTPGLTNHQSPAP